MVKTYLGLAHFLGAADTSPEMELAVTPGDEAAADRVLGRCGLGRGFVVLNPGANYGSSKCWPPAYFAAVADALAERGLAVAVSGAPGERAIVDAIRAASRTGPARPWSRPG